MDDILGLILTSLSIIGLLVSGAVWVILVVSKVSVRVTNQERDIAILKGITSKLEEKTSFEHLEQVTTKVMLQVIHSKEFKDSIRDVMTHLERNRSAAQTGAFEEILSQIKEIKNER